MGSVLSYNSGALYVALGRIDTDILDDIGIDPLMTCHVKIDVYDQKVELSVDGYIVDSISYPNNIDLLNVVNSKTTFSNCSITINMNTFNRLGLSHCSVFTLTVNSKIPIIGMNVYKSNIVTLNTPNKPIGVINVSYCDINNLCFSFIDQLNLKYTKVESIVGIYIKSMMLTSVPQIRNILAYISNSPKNRDRINTFGVDERVIDVGGELREVKEIMDECIDIYIPYVL